LWLFSKILNECRTKHSIYVHHRIDYGDDWKGIINALLNPFINPV
jgi:hypothetical protein